MQLFETLPLQAGLKTLEPKPLKLSVQMRPVNCPSLEAHNRLLNVHFTAVNYFPFLYCVLQRVRVCVCLVWAYISENRVSSSCHAVIGLGAFSNALHRRTIVVCGCVRVHCWSFVSRGLVLSCKPKGAVCVCVSFSC